jgi:hypothetical protein
LFLHRQECDDPAITESWPAGSASHIAPVWPHSIMSSGGWRGSR